MSEISIIVPVYNVEQYLRDCLDSILSQTFSDFELLLVDDGSPDHCLAICREYARRDSRIRVFHQENQGQAAARNFALSQAKGQWVCFVDSDDLIHPQMVELLYSAVQEEGVGISMCQMLEAQTLPGDFLRTRSEDFALLPMDEATLTELFDHNAYPAWVSCAKLIRRDLVEQHPFCPGRVYEDNEAVCHWVCGAGKLALSSEELYFYRSNPVSTTQAAFSLKRLDYLWALERIIHFYQELGYAGLVQRFCGLYAQAAAGFYRRTKHELHLPDKAKEIQDSARRLFVRERLPLGKEDREALLDAFFPRLMPVYWVWEAVCRKGKKKEKGA